MTFLPGALYLCCERAKSALNPYQWRYPMTFDLNNSNDSGNGKSTKNEKLNGTSMMQEAAVDPDFLTKDQKKILGATEVAPGLYTVNLSAVVLAYNDGIIVPYEHNRGGHPLNMSWVQEIADNFRVLSLGMIRVAQCGDYLVLADTHHQMEAAALAYKQGKISEDTVHVITVVTLGSMLTQYTDINKHKRHSLRQKTTNPELYYGAQLKEVVHGLTKYRHVSTKEALKNSNNLAYIMEHMRRGERFNDEELRFWDIFDRRKAVNSNANVPMQYAGEWKLRDNDIGKLSKAISQWQKLREAIGPVDEKDFKRLVNNRGFQTLILIQYLAENDISEIPVQTLADRIRKNHGALVGFGSSKLTGGNREDSVGAELEVKRVLRGNRKSKRI